MHINSPCIPYIMKHTQCTTEIKVVKLIRVSLLETHNLWRFWKSKTHICKECTRQLPCHCILSSSMCVKTLHQDRHADEMYQDSSRVKFQLNSKINSIIYPQFSRVLQIEWVWRVSLQWKCCTPTLGWLLPARRWLVYIHRTSGGVVKDYCQRLWLTLYIWCMPKFAQAD